MTATGSTPQLDQATTFLEALFAGKPADDPILIWSVPSKLSRWCPTIGSAIDSASRLAAAENVYVGMVTTDRAYGPYQRTSHDRAHALYGLFTDIDVAGPTHAQAQLPPTKADARALFAEAIAYAPTIVVDTDGGLQGYHLFREPWLLESGAERLAARELSDRYQDTIIARAALHGWTPERTADLARVLRVPGTLNHKIAGDPRPVRLLELDDGRRYDPSDLSAVLVAPARTGAAEPRPHDGAPLPIGFVTRVFVEQGAQITEQRPMVLHLARNYWGAGRDVEEAVSAAWRGIQASPWRADDPWTEEAVRAIVEDVYGRPAPALKPLAPIGRLLLHGKPVGERPAPETARRVDDRLPPIRRRPGIVLPPPRRPAGVAIETLLGVTA
jgi:hypothetical protein